MSNLPTTQTDCIKQLEKLVDQLKWFETTVRVRKDGGDLRLCLTSGGPWISSAKSSAATHNAIQSALTASAQGEDVRLIFIDAENVFPAPEVAATLETGLMELAKISKNLILESITAKQKTAKGMKSPLSGTELLRLTILAWYEAAGSPAPQADELTSVSTTKRPKPNFDEQRKQLVETIRTVPDANVVLNKITQEEMIAIEHIKNTDLSHLNLAKLNFRGLDLDGCNFDCADLSEAQLHCSMKNASFKSANLRGAALTFAKLNTTDFTAANLSAVYLSRAKVTATNFSGANLSSAQLVGLRLLGSNFTDANLNGADLAYADLTGVDLSSATLTGIRLDHTLFNEETKFPPEFGYPKGLKWKGQGPDPTKPQTAKPARKTPTVAGSREFVEFVSQISETCDHERVRNALKMLKSERFQIFNEVKADSLTGVIKSQTDAELVYSCRLSDSGDFACCTQNLMPCGGLRSALCKHLLVLLIGLARADQIDLDKTSTWVQASRAKQPILNKDIMAETFLRYQGAQAGEIDWRPTETIPEDYYSI